MVGARSLGRGRGRERESVCDLARKKLVFRKKLFQKIYGIGIHAAHAVASS